MLLLLGAFPTIACDVAAGDTLAFDRWLLQRLRSDGDPGVPIGPGWLRRAMTNWTALGSGPVLTLITVLAAGYLLVTRKVLLAVFLAVAISAGGLVNDLLKSSFVRPRPDVVPHLVAVDSASFPSGHAMNSAMVYLTLGALLASAERSRRVRLFLLSAAVLVTLIVGLSRPYLGVHYPSDVLAGSCVGAAWAIGSHLVARRLQRGRAIQDSRPHPPWRKRQVERTPDPAER